LGSLSPMRITRRRPAAATATTTPPRTTISERGRPASKRGEHQLALLNLAYSVRSKASRKRGPSLRGRIRLEKVAAGDRD
jgi:hypothetical protein